jgi:ABC-type amino acid transport substrate-binding protein
LGLKPGFSGEHMAIAAREGNTELRDQIDAAVAELQAEGFAEELALRYLYG